MLSRDRRGKMYRAGPRGVRITWPDGSVSTLAARAVVTFGEQQPTKIEGRLFRLGPYGQPTYETPALEPQL
jgi:hypothetical protein